MQTPRRRSNSSGLSVLVGVRNRPAASIHTYLLRKFTVFFVSRVYRIFAANGLQE